MKNIDHCQGREHRAAERLKRSGIYPAPQRKTGAVNSPAGIKGEDRAGYTLSEGVKEAASSWLSPG